MSQFIAENYFDSEDLMSWLLLNPDMADFDNLNIPLLNPTGTSSSNGATDIKNEPDGFMSRDFDHEMTGSTANYVSTKDLLEDGKKGGKKVKKRPREAEKDIEARVQELRAENADLQAHLLNVTQRTTEVQRQRANMEKLMQTKLEEIGGSEDSAQSELAVIVKQYTDIYADYGKCRQKEVRSL